MADNAALASTIKDLALAGGFNCAGITAATAAPQADRFIEWLARGYHGEMAYLATNVDKRLRPDLLVPGARSVICLAVSYAPASQPAAPGSAAPFPFVARYARSRDYHKILKRRCRALMDEIRRIEPAFEGRAFVDSAPVAERALAAAAGIGWIGRNGNLIVPQLGSYVLLCEIVCNLDLPSDLPIDSQCDNCDACVRACPTAALVGDAAADARKCISYLTIEYRGDIDESLRAAMGTCVFGCDACQDACPHNRDKPAGDAELISRQPPLGGAGLADILAWGEDDWDRITRGSALRRAKYATLMRNAVIAAGNALKLDSLSCEEKRRILTALETLNREKSDLSELIEWAVRTAV